MQTALTLPATPRPRRTRYAAPPEPDALPLVKWVGGKGSLWPRVGALLPPVIRGTYYEPMVGGGATFFALARAGRLAGPVVLSDVNPHLLALYRAVQRAPEAALRLLREMEQRYDADAEGVFYAERAALQTESADEETAARVLFLNRTCFNGLWRVNSKGAFNASWCRNNPRPRIVFATRLHACSRALRGVTLLHADYREALTDVRQGDVVFLDPPYIPVSDTADFTAYAAGGFDDGAQVAIRDEANRVRALGACVLACNADVPRARALWTGWPLAEVKAKRGVNSDANKRGPVGELLIGGV